jgi:hypothetical protein
MSNTVLPGSGSGSGSGSPALEHPAPPPFDFAHYQRERYRERRSRSRALTAYYAAKPLLPRALQLQVRRRYARRQAQRSFPAWPIEPILVEAANDQLRALIGRAGGARVPIVGYWPDGLRAACVLTHDVEGTRGIEQIQRVLEVERRHGLVSSWNFVAEDYPVPLDTFALLRDAGCEIGVHGIKHDGKLFQSRRRFEADLPKIQFYLHSWGAAGFRSPATHRRAEWMHELGCLYDSSFPDTDPFEPQPGGCCSILPFMFGDVVELPITLVQDHTLWEILQGRSIEPWREKAAWIIANHGLVNLITHPDYFTCPERFAMYDELLGFLAGERDCWHALPREVAQWWKRRHQLSCRRQHDGAAICGPEVAGATIWWAALESGRISLTPEVGA